MIIIIRGQEDIITRYNLNLLKEDQLNDKDKLELLSKINNQSLFKNSVTPILKVDISNIQIKDIENKYNLRNSLTVIESTQPIEEFELYNEENLMQYYRKNIDFNKIKNFMKKIIRSTCIKEAYTLFYGEKIKYPFDTEKIAEDFVDNYIEFICLKDKTAKGATNKFTLKTKIFLMKREIIPNDINSVILYKFLYPGYIIKIFFHELNHNFYNYYYFQSNGTIPLSTPRKNDFEEREGGKYFEFLLFKQKVKKLNLKQVLYLLNEKNYQKSLTDFNNGFTLLKKEDITIEGEFSYLNDILKNLIKDEDNLSDILIRTDDNLGFDLDDYSLDANIDNDVLGSYI